MQIPFKLVGGKFEKLRRMKFLSIEISYDCLLLKDIELGLKIPTSNFQLYLNLKI